MALRDSLGIGPLTIFDLLSSQWCVLFLCLAKLNKRHPIRAKRLFGTELLTKIQRPSDGKY